MSRSSLLALAVLQACAASDKSSGIAGLSQPNPTLPKATATQPIQVKIYVSTYNAPLGAFDLEVHYNDDVGRILDKEPPTAGPHVQFFKWRRGKHRTYVRVEGFYSKEGPIEERQVHVATVLFHRTHDGQCDLRIEALGVYDTSGRDIKGAVTFHANPPILFFQK